MPRAKKIISVESSRETLDWLRPYWRPRPRESVSAWAARAVDYSRDVSYPTPLRGPFNPDYMPYWVEVMDCVSNPNIREIVVLKAARTGGTECVMLTSMRWAIATRPQPILYVVSDQLSADRFWRTRILRGLKLSAETEHALKHATENTKYDLHLPQCDVRITWPRARQAFKQDGWALVLCDEVSTWPEYTPDMARRRTDTYPFPHIIFLSTPDPAQKRGSADDPIFVEYERGDKRKWMMPDPRGGEFTFEMGVRGNFGLQWDQSARRDDGTWDYDLVRKSAHYVTPAGTVITQRERLEYVRKGHWVPTSSCPSNVRSYHVPVFLSPFRSGDFGEVAVAFLRAKEQGTIALRTFVYEWLAEPWYAKKDEATAEDVTARIADYMRSENGIEKLGWPKTCAVIVTVDVQRDCFWVVARAWNENGDSALIDYAKVQTWAEVEDFARKYDADHVGVDSAYSDRTQEIYEYCARYLAHPLRGSDNLRALISQRTFDVYEGRAQQGRNHLVEIVYNANAFRSLRLDLQRAKVPLRWALPKDITHEYAQQITTEIKVDGEWKMRRGTKANHLGDCETMQLVLAHMLQLLHRVIPDLERVSEERLEELSARVDTEKGSDNNDVEGS